MKRPCADNPETLICNAIGYLMRLYNNIASNKMVIKFESKPIKKKDVIEDEMSF